MATGQCERSGTSGLDPELRIKSSNSVPDPSIPDQGTQYLKIHIALGVRSMPVPYVFHAKYLAHTYPVSLVGASKSESSFQTLQISCAIQTHRIRQHGNVHTGHMVLTSSQMMQHVNAPTAITDREASCRQVSFGRICQQISMLPAFEMRGAPSEVDVPMRLALLLKLPRLIIHQIA